MRALKVAALLGWMLMRAAGSTVPNSLTIVVFDHVGVPRPVLISAMKEGPSAFRAAGVETEWNLCDPVEGCYVPERFVKVKILSRTPHATHVSRDVLGSTTCVATEHCVASDVFYNRVLTFADDASATPDLTLAYVMVHEGVDLILDIDRQAARTALRSGRSVSSMAGPHRSLRARALNCTMC